MTDHNEDGHVCMDCQQDLVKKFEDLLSSFDEEKQKLIYELININDLIQNALHTDINSSIAALNRKGCVKINISFTGKTTEGKKIKSKDDVIVRFV